MSRLEIKDLSLLVHLGVPSAERVALQEVRISIDFIFGEIPLACETDELSDTQCYFKICEQLTQKISGKEVKTIEKLSSLAILAVREAFKEAQGKVRIHKVRPPIEGLMGGVIFERDI